MSDSDICTVHYLNATPADWHVRIVEIGAHFFVQDQDGNPVRDYTTTKQTNLDYNQSDTIMSAGSNECIVGVYAGCTAYVPDGNGGGEDQNFTSTSMTDKSHCLLDVPFTLAPKGSQEVKGPLHSVLNAKPLRLLTEAEYKEELRLRQAGGLKPNPEKSTSKP